VSVATERRIVDVLADARSRIVRYLPAELEAAGVVLVDIRSHDERARDGIVPGSIHVPYSVLQWRCDPGSGWSNPHVADRSLPLTLVCTHGYSSSLAAASLVELGFEHAGDVAGGFAAWCEAGLPVAVAPPVEIGRLPGMGDPECPS
jgi:rhodanese-related sulfurtransferase